MGRKWKCDIDVPWMVGGGWGMEHCEENKLGWTDACRMTKQKARCRVLQVSSKSTATI